VPSMIQWSGPDARAFQQAAGLTNERLAERLHVSARSVAYWRNQTAGPLPDLAQRVLTRALDAADEPVRHRFEAIRRARAPAAFTNVTDDVVAAAAEEASADLMLLTAEFDPESLTWLWEESLETARAANRPALDTFTAAQRIRGQALQLADHTRRPSVLSDLYVICGQATALMASTAFDLDRWRESAALAQSAISYASLAGHSSLQAWTLGLAALLANWRSEPDTALNHYRHGMQIAPVGAPQVRLQYIASRSHALLGDIASVAEVLERAQRDQDDAHLHPDSLSEEIGGEFAFGRARAQACAAAAWLDLGLGPEAFKAAQCALSELGSLPPGRRSLSQVNGARIDLATACLLNRDGDGAIEAISPVLALPASLRNVSLTGRLVRTRNTLLAQPFSNDSQVRHLADDVNDWLTQRPPSAQAIAGQG